VGKVISFNTEGRHFLSFSMRIYDILISVCSEAYPPAMISVICSLSPSLTDIASSSG
jgi:hypothetical protein